MSYFFQFPYIFYLLLAAIFSHGKSTLWHRSLASLLLVQVLYKSPGYVTSPWMLPKSHTALPGVAAQLSASYQLAIVMETYHPSPPPTSLPWAVGNMLCYFQGSPALHPISLWHCAMARGIKVESVWDDLHCIHRDMDMDLAMKKKSGEKSIIFWIEKNKMGVHKDQW